MTCIHSGFRKPAVSGSNRFDLFARTRESLGQHLSEVLTEGLPALADALAQSAIRSDSPVARDALMNAARVLRTDVRGRVKSAISTLNDLTFRLLELNQSKGRVDDSAWLSLLPERELELQILADELANAIQEQIGDVYPGWLKRIEQLTLQAASETRVPFGAATIAAASLSALEPVTAERSLRTSVRIAVLEELAPRLAGAIRQTDIWLEAQGVLPSEAATRSFTDEASAAASIEPEFARPMGAVARVPRDGVPERQTAQPISAALRASNTLGFQPLSMIAPGEPDIQRAASLPRPFQLAEDAIDFAARHGVEPYSREARRLYFLEPRAQMLRMGASPEQLAVLDLVAGLFDQVCDDSKIPPAARGLIWRLQQPVAVLSMLDAGFLGDSRRSLRDLIEAIASISTTYGEELEQQGEVFQRLETSVRALEVMAHTLQARALAIGIHIGREYGRAAEGVKTLLSKLTRERQAVLASPNHGNRRNMSRRPSPEMEEAVTQRLERALRERLSRAEVPDSIQEFLLAVWLRHLRTAVLRDGENSAEFKQAMQVVDDLLWTLDASGPGLSRKQLANRIPPLIRTLRQGVQAVGARQEEYQPFLDTLFLMHLRKMQKVPQPSPESQTSKASEGSTDLQQVSTGSVAELSQDDPPTIWLDDSLQAGQRNGVQQDRGIDSGLVHRGDPMVVESVLAVGRSSSPEDTVMVADDERLPSVLASVDLNDFPPAPRRLQLRPDELAVTLRLGDWLEMDGRGGEMQQVKVAWLNGGRTVVLLLRRQDRRVVSLQMGELQRRFANRQAWMIV